MSTVGSKHQHTHSANPILAQNRPCVHLFEVVPRKSQMVRTLLRPVGRSILGALKAPVQAAHTASQQSRAGTAGDKLINKRKSGGNPVLVGSNGSDQSQYKEMIIILTCHVIFYIPPCSLLFSAVV